VTSLGRTWLSTMLMRCCLLSVMGRSWVVQRGCVEELGGPADPAGWRTIPQALRDRPAVAAGCGCRQSPQTPSAGLQGVGACRPCRPTSQLLAGARSHEWTESTGESACPRHCHAETTHDTCSRREATWRSGDAADCKSAHPGSIPGVASNKINNLSVSRDFQRAPTASGYGRTNFQKKRRPA